MTEKKLSKNNDKNSLISRLNRIEGQVRGIKNMIDEERYCVDILTQISSIKSAIDKVGNIILQNHIKGCVLNSINNGENEENEVMIDELIGLINTFKK